MLCIIYAECHYAYCSHLLVIFCGIAVIGITVIAGTVSIIGIVEITVISLVIVFIKNILVSTFLVVTLKFYFCLSFSISSLIFCPPNLMEVPLTFGQMPLVPSDVCLTFSLVLPVLKQAISVRLLS
jgi:hypothetical protein